ncbi:MAG: FecR family protein [Verrucomicrobiota bacterium]
MKNIVAVLSLFITALLAYGADSPAGLKESTIVETVSDVSVLTGKDLDSSPAFEGEIFKAPDFLETGRRSRARLEAEDGTITRIGSNTLFSFQENDRTIKLERGSILFSSPEGRGGGRIVTASATASVVGTTIIVEATEDGGFKVFVLEGSATVTFPDNSTAFLEAGQMTFVQPNLPGVSNGESGRGPVLNFDLEAFVKDSQLVNGFDSPLQSLPFIDAAIAEQDQRIEDGSLQKAGRFVLLSDDDNIVDLDLAALNKLFENEDDRALDGLEPMVLVGGISALVETADVAFGNLPSGKVVTISDEGVETLDPEDVGEIPAELPRVTVGAIDFLPEDQKAALAIKLEKAFEEVLKSYEDGSVSAEDTIAIAKFLLSLDLPLDERFKDDVEDQFGPLLDEPDEEGPFEDSQDLLDDSTQVTDPIDINDGYFAP